MRETASTYCLIKGRVTSLAEITTRRAKRLWDPSRPPLPPAPKVRDKVQRDAEKRKLRKQIRKLFPRGAWKKWNSNASIARQLDVPYADLYCLIADRPIGPKAIARIKEAVEAKAAAT